MAFETLQTLISRIRLALFKTSAIHLANVLLFNTLDVVTNQFAFFAIVIIDSVLKMVFLAFILVFDDNFHLTNDQFVNEAGDKGLVDKYILGGNDGLVEHNVTSTIGIKLVAMNANIVTILQTKDAQSLKGLRYNFKAGSNTAIMSNVSRMANAFISTFSVIETVIWTIKSFSNS